MSNQELMDSHPSNYNLSPFAIHWNRIQKNKNRNSLVESQMIVIGILQLLDILTTYFAISLNLAEEQNPLGAWIFNQIGLIPGLILFKSIALSILALGYYWYLTQESKWFQKGFKLNLWFGIALYLGVVISNTLVILLRM